MVTSAYLHMYILLTDVTAARDDSGLEPYDDSFVKDAAGWGLVAILFLALAISVSFILNDLVQQLWLKLKRWLLIRKMRNAAKIVATTT